MKKTVNRKFYDLVAKKFPDHEIYEYSGRGMYGESCYAVTVSLREADALLDKAPNLRIDNLGLDYVVYTGIKMTEDDESFLEKI